MNFHKSKKLLARAYQVIPSASQTFSKGPTQWPSKGAPNFLSRGNGAWVWDVDDNKFLDYLMALGPIILGYGNEAVCQAVANQFQKGPIFSQMHPLEVKVAEIITNRIPYADMIRFGKNGSDATTAAVRAARAFTNREHIIYCGYHGWHDWYIGTTTRADGVPKDARALTHSFEYNNLDSLRDIFNQYPGKIAGVIMEAVGVEMPESGFLEEVRSLTQDQGALLIFDEIINGFRIAFGGSVEYHQVIPDLACFGKAMANGAPLSAVVGRREVMEIFDKIFFSGTFGGDATALAACEATIGEIDRLHVFDHIWKYGKKLSIHINNLIQINGLEGVLNLIGYDARSILAFPDPDEYQSRLRRSYFMQECHKRSLLFFGPHLTTASHGLDELEFTLNIYDEVVPLFAKAYHNNDIASKMEGEITQPIFRKP
jgi:glutamate-1-semialdehyde 2,1-aminomutase/spore coat polysaccharide biosynthesis protein SpsF